MPRNAHKSFFERIFYCIETWISQEERTTVRVLLRFLFYGSIAAILIFSTLYIFSLGLSGVKNLYEETVQFLVNGEYVAWKVVTVIVIVALLVNLFKNSEAQSLYGLVEVCLAVVWINYTLTHLSESSMEQAGTGGYKEIIRDIGLFKDVSEDTIDKLLLLFGGLFLLNRGFDNFVKGFDKIPSLLRNLFK